MQSLNRIPIFTRITLLGLVLMVTSLGLFGQNSIKYLALGDSYTIGESIEEAGRWPNQLAAMMRESGKQVTDPVIIARTGWTTGELMEAIQVENPADDFDMVSLLTGVNNQYRGYSLTECKAETETLLQTAIRLAGGDKDKVFMVSIPDYGYMPFGAAKKEKNGAEIDQFNAAAKAVADAYNVKFIDITPASRQERDDWVADDELHPSAVQYKAWVEVIWSALNP